MTENLHDIDDLFRDPINGHTEEVPPEVWDRIDRTLDKRQAAFYKRRYFTVRYAALALLFLGLGGLAAVVYMKVKHNGSDGQVQAPRIQAPVTPGVASPPMGMGEGRSEDRGVASGDGLHTGERPLKKEEAVFGKDGGAVNTDGQVVVKNNAEVKKTDKEGAALDQASVNNKTSVSARDKTVNRKSKVLPVLVQEKDNAKNALAVQDKKKERRNKLAGSREPVASGIYTGGRDVVDIPDADADVKKREHMNTVGPVAVSAGRSSDLSLLVHTSSIADRNDIVAKVATAGRNRHAPEEFSLMPYYGRGANMNELRDDDRFRDPRNNRDEARRTEGPDGVSTVGLLVQKGITPKISVQAGLSYFTSRMHIGPKTVFARADNNGSLHYEFNCSSGKSYLPLRPGPPPAPGDSIRIEAAQSRISYVSVPLGVSYRVDIGKVSLRPALGVVPNFLVRGRVSSNLPAVTGAGKQAVTTEIDGLKKMYLGAYFQPALELRLNDRFSFNLLPQLNLSFTPINKGTAVRTFQNTAGLSAGLSIKL